MNELFGEECDPLLRAGSSSTDLLLPRSEEPLLPQSEPSAGVLVLNRSRDFEPDPATLKREREESVVELALSSQASVPELAAKRMCPSPGYSPATSSCVFTPSNDGSDTTELVAPKAETAKEKTPETAEITDATETLQTVVPKVPEVTDEPLPMEVSEEELSLAVVVKELRELCWRGGAWERLLWVLCSDRGCLVPWRLQAFLAFFGGLGNFSVDDAQFLLGQAAFCGFRTAVSLQRDVAVCAALPCYACAFCADLAGGLTIVAKDCGCAVTRHTVHTGYELREALLAYEGFEPAALRHFATGFVDSL